MIVQPVIQGSILTEILIPASVSNNQSFPFPDIPELSNRNQQTVITGIEALNGTDNAANTMLTKSPNGFDVIIVPGANTGVSGVFVTLAEENTEKIYRYTLSQLIAHRNFGVRMFNRKKINWQKSYITVYDTTVLLVSGKQSSAVFNIMYEIIK